MTFSFNPSLWFVCKLCRGAFPDTGKLKAHKLESHLEESLNIKCIVFEEKLLDHEWVPPSASQELDSNRGKTLILSSSAVTQRSTTDGTTRKTLRCQEKVKFKNPYVSLKLLTAQDINSNSARGQLLAGTDGSNTAVLTTCKTKSSAPEDGRFPLKQLKTDINDDNVHKNKIRKLLSSAVIIKSEPNNDSNNRPFSASASVSASEEQDLPISIVSTYSLSSSPSVSDSSKIINPLNDNNLLFDSLQQEQPHQLELLQENSEGILPMPSPMPIAASSNFGIINIPFSPEILRPTFIMQPQDVNMLSTQVQTRTEFKAGGRSRSKLRYQDKIGNLRKLNANFLSGVVSTSTVNNRNAGKTEFIVSDLIEQNRNLETICDGQLSSESFANAGAGADGGSRDLNKIQNSFVCPICSASFSKSKYLDQHVPWHSNSRPHQCPHCDLSFKSRGNLRSHLIVRHGRSSSFRCQFCDKSFTTKDYLVGHESTHTGVLPFKCDFPNCGIEFKHKCSLSVHVRRTHGEELGLPQFGCPTCGKSFGVRSSLNSHQKHAHRNPNSDVEILS